MPTIHVEKSDTAEDIARKLRATDPPRFRKKPVEIEAVRWGHPGAPSRPQAIVNWITERGGQAGYVLEPFEALEIVTLEGAMYASPGDWIIRGVAGEFYPCKPDIFAATYEAV